MFDLLLYPLYPSAGSFLVAAIHAEPLRRKETVTFQELCGDETKVPIINKYYKESRRGKAREY